MVHKLPTDLRKAINADARVKEVWADITPLARNEWICWTISVKQVATREDHLRRVVAELKEGMRRPCCWLGCIHRTDKSISPSVKHVLDKRARSKILK